MKNRKRSYSGNLVFNVSRHVRHVSGEGSGDTNAGTGGVSAEEAETETDDTDNHDMKLMHIARCEDCCLFIFSSSFFHSIQAFFSNFKFKERGVRGS